MHPTLRQAQSGQRWLSTGGEPKIFLLSPRGADPRMGLQSLCDLRMHSNVDDFRLVSFNGSTAIEHRNAREELAATQTFKPCAPYSKES